MTKKHLTRLLTDTTLVDQLVTGKGSLFGEQIFLCDTCDSGGHHSATTKLTCKGLVKNQKSQLIISTIVCYSTLNEDR